MKIDSFTYYILGQNSNEIRGLIILTVNVKMQEQKI